MKKIFTILSLFILTLTARGQEYIEVLRSADNSLLVNPALFPAVEKKFIRTFHQILSLADRCLNIILVSERREDELAQKLKGLRS